MEYGIIAKPITLVNTMSNAILERIHHVIGNLVRTCNITHHYIEKDDPWLRILYSAAFLISSTTNNLRVYSPGQLVFGRDMILPIKHAVY